MGEYFTPIYGQTDLDEDELKRTLEIMDNEQVEINLQFLSEDPNFFLNIGYEDAEEISKPGKLQIRPIRKYLIDQYTLTSLRDLSQILALSGTTSSQWWKMR